MYAFLYTKCAAQDSTLPYRRKSEMPTLWPLAATDIYSM